MLGTIHIVSFEINYFLRGDFIKATSKTDSNGERNYDVLYNLCEQPTKNYRIYRSSFKSAATRYFMSLFLMSFESIDLQDMKFNFCFWQFKVS